MPRVFLCNPSTLKFLEGACGGGGGGWGGGGGESGVIHPKAWFLQSPLLLLCLYIQCVYLVQLIIPLFHTTLIRISNKSVI